MRDQTEVDLFDRTEPPAAEFARDASKRVLDDLFENVATYRNSDAYLKLMEFTAQFRFYSPFNAMLVHVQMEGATYVAPAHRWARTYQRKIKPGARPLVILQPMGPVMFVFDVADTEPGSNSPPLPSEVENPFIVTNGQIGAELTNTVRNAARDGIEIEDVHAGSQFAGSVQVTPANKQLQFQTKIGPPADFISVPRRYHLSLNKHQSPESRYATLAHELGHLYAGHLGSPNQKWWPDRRGLDLNAREFEAESISYLVCARLGIVTPSAEYLTNYVSKNRQVPDISLDCVMKAAGLVEQMGRQRLGKRKVE